MGERNTIGTLHRYGIHNPIMSGTESTDGEYVCDACGRVFESEEELSRHTRDVGLVY